MITIQRFYKHFVRKEIQFNPSFLQSQNIVITIDDDDHDDVSPMSDNDSTIFRKESSKQIMKELNVPDKFVESIKREQLKNHREIISVIEDHISTAEPDKKLGRYLITYLKYATFFISLTESGETTIRLKDLGVHYPKNLLPMIEKKLFKLQAKYYKCIEQFYYT